MIEIIHALEELGANAALRGSRGEKFRQVTAEAVGDENVLPFTASTEQWESLFGTRLKLICGIHPAEEPIDQPDDQPAQPADDPSPESSVHQLKLSA